MPTFDRADWHYAGDFPTDLPPENSGTHIGMFLSWAIMNGLVSDVHASESADALAAVRTRKMTGREFLFRECDEKLTDLSLNDEGNAFAAWYYGGAASRFLADYERVVGAEFPTIYHVPDTWVNYERIAPIISERYEAWKARGARPWWRFWGE